MKELLTKKEVARLCKVSERHISDLVKEGEFPKPLKLGHAVRFRQEDIEGWMKGDDEWHR
jgi:excisionase family DNA binding protein